MNRVICCAEWLGTEWLRFLVWFSIGLFVIPIGVSIVTGWINLDRFYDGLIPGNLNVGVILLVAAPYLIYLVYRVSHAGAHHDEIFDEEHEFG